MVSKNTLNPEALCDCHRWMISEGEGGKKLQLTQSVLMSMEIGYCTTDLISDRCSVSTARAELPSALNRKTFFFDAV